MSEFVAPKHEPQVITFLARKLYGGDESRVPTTMMRAFKYCDVQIVSTGRQAREYELMVKIIKALAEDERDIITQITCHTEVGYRFSVRAATRQPSAASDVTSVIHQTCLKHLGGHGGIEVISHGGAKTSMIAQWGGRMDVPGH